MSIILYINYTIYNVPDIHVLYSDLSYDLEPFKGQIDVQEANVLCNAHLNNNAQRLTISITNTFAKLTPSLSLTKRGTVLL